jgi:hypothetical protein
MLLYSAPLASSDITPLRDRRLSPNGPAQHAELTLEMCGKPYCNGEDVRRDGAIWMGPR